MKKHATDTSTCSTSTNKPKRCRARGKEHVQTRVSTFQNVLQDDVAIAGKPFGFRPWKSVRPLVRFLRSKGFSVNAVLNKALLYFLDAEASDDWLRDEARLVLLLREEQQLIQLNKVMLRSGAYLDLYADKVLRGGRARLDAKLGRKPLGALAPDEEPIFKRMVARREAIVQEIREIMGRRLPEKEYVLKDERPVTKKSWSRRRAKNKLEGGE